MERVTWKLTFSSVQSLSHVHLFATPWIAARQASLSITSSWSSPKLMCIESVMPSSHLVLCRPLLLLLPIPPSIRVFSNESAFRIRWPKYWSFRLSKTYISICKLDSQWEFAVCLRKLKQGLCINLEERGGEGNGREIQKGENICIPMADSCWGLTENNIIL